MQKSSSGRPALPTPAILDCGGKSLPLDRPRIMGVLNVTPDSFSDGGRFLSPEAALRQADIMLSEGVDIIDIGGESTRPGADEVSIQEELDRVMPVLERVATEFPIPVSVDTSKPEVMREAARCGAGMINDVMGLRRPGALEAAAGTALPVCLTHMQGEPRSMQDNPRYGDVVGEVMAFLGERVAACAGAGIARQRLVLDPGFGFGKAFRHNYGLLRELGRVVAMGLPVLVGISRKSMIGQALGDATADRLIGSVAAAVLAAREGARILRVHDVAATRQAMAIVCATLDPEQPAASS